MGCKYHEEEWTMVVSQIAPALMRSRVDAEKRWFYGGGVHTWLATSEETLGAFLLFEAVMDKGKRTPLHTHPDSEESLYLVDGEVLMHMDGDEQAISAGGLVIAPRNVPHAFLVLSDTATMLCLQTPGMCQAFYLGASEPLAGSARTVDFGLIAKSGQDNGGIEILGPPPFPND
jgi:quercetin dioxygenase-like cupin family protein